MCSVRPPHLIYIINNFIFKIWSDFGLKKLDDDDDDFLRPYGKLQEIHINDQYKNYMSISPTSSDTLLDRVPNGEMK